MTLSRLTTMRRPRADAAAASERGGGRSLVLDRYRLDRRLGAGGFGTVWLARDQRLEREVAIKILARELVVDGRFEREARAAARLTHPGIVTLYEAAVDDEGAYLVSELVRGETLDRLHRAGRLSDRDVLAIGIAICDALAHAHTAGVVHRDVKPSNVLVPNRPETPTQTAKLTDFGVARVVGGDSLTHTGDVIGTAAYMAPEQAAGREAGPPADLYSLALVIYEALTDVNPARVGRSANRGSRLGSYLPPLRRQRRDLPRELAHGIDLALRPRPRERGSVEDLRGTLSAVVDDVHDEIGVIGAPWPARAVRSIDWRTGQLDHDRTDGRLPASTRDRRVPEATSSPAPDPNAGWPARALAGAGAATVTAWLCAHVLVPSPIAPAVAAVAAGVIVAGLPRLGWLGLAAVLAIALAVHDRPGGALVVAVAALVPVALLPRQPLDWPLAIAAPALGMMGLAGAWPALCVRAGTAWRRAALGVAGWTWLVLAVPLVGQALYTRPLPSSPAVSVWVVSIYDSVHHVLAPLVTAGALIVAPVWAAAAVVLHLIRTGRLAIDVVLVTVWAATLASATTAALSLVHERGLVAPGSLVLGAVAGAVVALAPQLAHGVRGARQKADDWAPLA